jgi:hypothetical protein
MRRQLADLSLEPLERPSSVLVQRVSRIRPGDLDLRSFLEL